MDRLSEFLNDPDEPRLPGFSTPGRVVLPVINSKDCQHWCHKAIPAEPSISNTSTAPTRSLFSATLSRVSDITRYSSGNAEAPPCPVEPPSASEFNTIPDNSSKESHLMYMWKEDLISIKDYPLTMEQIETKSSESRDKGQLKKVRKTRKGKQRHGNRNKHQISHQIQFPNPASDMGHVSEPGLEVLKRKTIHHSQLKATNQQLLGCTDEHQVSAETAAGTPTSLMAESTSSEDETDWESDIDRCEHLQIFNHEYSKGLENEHSLAGPSISLFKSKLVDRIMQEFWLIFNQDWTSNPRQCNPSNSRSGPGTASQETPKGSADNGSLKDGSNQSYNQDTTSKRSRKYGDDPPSDEDDGIGPRSPRRVSRSPENGHDGRKFACPYRKHNRRKYCLPNWRTCALTPQLTVARLKAHLYNYHRIYQCQRCKDLFGSQDELDIHIQAPKGCDVKSTPVLVEGITSRIMEQLKSRKKRCPALSETEKWADIYRLLFPNEDVPEPYFEPVPDYRDNQIQSPGSQELTDYEIYIRREVPRLFRSALETAVNTEIEPIEERLTGRIMVFLEEAQDRAFSDYRTMHAFTANDPSSPALVLQGNDGIDGNLDLAEENTSIDVLEAFYQAPPPQVHLDSAFIFPEVVISSRNGRLNEFSDSGYVSNPSGSGLSQYAALERVPSNSTADRSRPSAEPVASDTASPGFCPTLFEEYHDSSMPAGENQANILPTFPNNLWPFSQDDLGLGNSDWELSQLLLRID